MVAGGSTATDVSKIAEVVAPGLAKQFGPWMLPLTALELGNKLINYTFDTLNANLDAEMKATSDAANKAMAEATAATKAKMEEAAREAERDRAIDRQVERNQNPQTSIDDGEDFDAFAGGYECGGDDGGSSGGGLNLDEEEIINYVV